MQSCRDILRFQKYHYSDCRLFEKVDLDHDNRLSHSELKKLVEAIQFGTVNLNVDVAVEELIEELDTDGDHLINKEEFVEGLSKFLIANSNKVSISNHSTAFILRVLNHIHNALLPVARLRG